MPGIGLHKTINSRIRRKLNYSINNQRIIGFSHSFAHNSLPQVTSQISTAETNVINTNSECAPESQCEDNELRHNIELHSSYPVESANYDTKISTPEKTLNAKQNLAQWAVTYNIKRNALDSLLMLLNTNPSFDDLPKDSRTLLQTPREIPIETLNPGYYCHFPAKALLTQILTESVHWNKVNLQINVDGLPISNSSSQQFWPILCRIIEVPTLDPFVLGLYYGLDKPKSSNQLLNKVVNDLKDLLAHGLELPSGQRIQIGLASVICDAPARAFLLNVKGHSGYHCCTKCIVEGDYVDRRMTFPETDCSRRTNETFRARTHEEHHLQFAESTELIKLPIDIIKQVPLDYQHLICLGVTRKLLNLWIKGRPSAFKFSAHQTLNLSRKIITIKKFFSSNFQRKPRSITHLKSWKATEYRTFLLYTGPVLLKNLLCQSYYDHFMCLHVAITILCSKSLYLKYNRYASDLLKYFVKIFPSLYGPEQVSYNVHGLVHIAEDSFNLGTLDDFSTFRFESYLGKLKKLVRAGNKPLHQAYNRIQERQKFLRGKPEVKNLELNFTLSDKQGDNACVLKSGKVLLISDIRDTNNKILIIGQTLHQSSSVYSNPIKSEILGIQSHQLKSDEIVYSQPDDILCKALVFTIEEVFYSFPILHSKDQ